MESINIMPALLVNIACFLIGIGLGLVTAVAVISERQEQKNKIKRKSEYNERMFAEVQKWANDFGKLP
jgi:hypothetical protein